MFVNHTPKTELFYRFLLRMTVLKFLSRWGGVVVDVHDIVTVSSSDVKFRMKVSTILNFRHK